MCGICCILRLPAPSNSAGISLCPHGGVHCERLSRDVQRRGPDASRTLSFAAAAPAAAVSHVKATSAVLSLRGSPGGAPQPTVAPEDAGAAQASFLQWNGEVFGGTLEIPAGEADTAAVMRRLRQLEREHCVCVPLTSDASEEEQREEQQRAFANACVRFFEFEVEGPYAFVYYAHSLGVFLIGRDPLGRRSLVTHASTVLRTGRAGDDNKSVSEAMDTGTKSDDTWMELEFVIASLTAPHTDEPPIAVAANASDAVIRPRRRLRENDKVQHTRTDKNKDTNGDPHEDTDNDKDDEADSPGECWSELPNTGLFLVRATGLTQFPWTRPHTVHPLMRFQLPCAEWPPRQALSLAPSALNEWAAAHYLSALRRAVSVRVAAEHCGGNCARPIGILFSGGIDSTVLAALADDTLPTVTPIELINVAFGEAPELTPDRIATFRAWEQLLALSRKGREWRLVLVDVARGAEATDVVQQLVRPCESVIDMSIGTALWHAAQGRGRMQRIYRGHETNTKEEENEKKKKEENENEEKESNENNGDDDHRHEAAVAPRCPHKHIRLSAPTEGSATETDPIALCVETDPYAPLVTALVAELEASGGADATAPVLLSTLGKDHAAPLRVAFTRRGHRRLGDYITAAAADGVVTFARRDEVSSKAVRLVRAADISRVRRVAPAHWLTRSANSSDESAAPVGETCASYEAEARVLLLGMGADETLGGYTRHRRAYERRGTAGLVSELRRDFARLWVRNLGRDDRAVGDSGREGRCPFLDEGVLNALGEIAAVAHSAAEADGASGEEALRRAMTPVCDFELGGPGVGDKKILRRCAEMLGLGEVVRLQKRAMQFGSRIAHVRSQK